MAVPLPSAPRPSGLGVEWRTGLATFLVVLALSVLVVWRLEAVRLADERERVESLASTHALALQRNMERALSATYPLAALVGEAKGIPQNFEALAAQMLPYYQGASALAIAPGGVVQRIAPLAGNEKALGHDLLKDPERDKEAIRARDTGLLTLAGPFKLVQGGMGAAGRLPVYFGEPGSRGAFWGFVVVLIRFPEVLQAADLGRLVDGGHAYELWRVNPDSGQRQVIAAAGGELRDPVDLAVNVPSATWTLSVAPVAGWGDPAGLAGKIGMAALLSLLATGLASLLVRDLKHRKILVARVEEATRDLRIREFELEKIVSEERTLIDALPDVIIRFDTAYRHIFVSDNVQRKLRMTAAEMYGKTPRELALPDEVCRLWESEIDAVFASGMARETEFSLAGPQGPRIYGCRLVPDVRADGKVMTVLAVLRDITDQHALASELQSERALLDTLVNAIPDLIWLKDPNGVYLSCNKRFERFFGAPRQVIVGKTDYDFVAPELADFFRAHDRAAMEKGEPTRNEELISFADDGHKELLETTKSALIAGNGKVLGVLGIGHDITDRKRIEQELARREAELRSYIDNAPTGVFVADPAGRYVEANPAACELVGYSREELCNGMTVADISGDEDLSAFMDEYSRVLQSGRGEFAVPLRRKDGRVITVSLRAALLPDGNIIGFATDISDRLQAEARMREALAVFNSSNQGIVTTDPQARIISINPAFSAITGYSPEEIVGQRMSVFKSGRHGPDFYADLWAALAQNGRWEGEIWNRRRNGQIYPEWLTISCIRDAGGEVIEYVALFSDITERKQQEEAVWRQANFDALTGLANRNLLFDRLERALGQARRNGTKVGLAFLDLDGFKWINDTLGHDIGDELLVEVARRLRGTVRDTDTVARLGGDEFTAVINGLSNVEDLTVIGDKLVGVLREPVTLAGSRHQITGSVGITVFPNDGGDVQTLLKNADIAMYKAKQGGRNRYQFYAHHMQVDAQARVQMEADLRLAIAQNGFMLHYQPIVEAASGELVGAEALLRWQHPERGMISPLDFIPVAEDCGLIVPIGEWALREAARQLGAWRAKGVADLRMSVNVSSVQFRDADLTALVSEVLREFGIPAGDLVLEITESVLMDGSAEAEARMREIKNLGIGYALDDFGTGFSSLSYLKRFPVDIVKVDRSFVSDCPDDRNDAHLVEAIINMARSLDLRVTAEGVETEVQYEFLRKLGCDYLQGYLAGRPVPPDGFEALIERHKLLDPGTPGREPESRVLAAQHLAGIPADS